MKNYLKRDNIVTITYALLQALNVPVTITTLNEKLQNHPNYPSLSSISDILNIFKIKNIAFEVSKDELAEIPTPFITFLYIEKGIFVLVNNIENAIVEWTHSEKGKQKETIETFTEKFN